MTSYSPKRKQPKQTPSTQSPSLQQPSPSRVSQWQNFKDAFSSFHNPLRPQQGPMSADRSKLDEHTAPLTHQPFPAAVNYVNRGLGLNTDAQIPSEKVDNYMNDTSAVANGQMSNTQAFSRSAYGWYQHKNYPAAAMNLGGAGMASFYDSIMQNQKNKGLGEDAWTQ